MKKSGFIAFKALGVILALVFALACGNPAPENKSERMPIKRPHKAEKEIVRSIMTVNPEEMYQQFTEQYKINPDKRIIRSFQELLGFYQKLNPASTTAYRIGDAARWAAEQRCDCGRNMPVIEAVEGRVEDICYTPDGREMLRFDTVFKGIANIREAQVIQEELDRFSILVIPTDEFDEQEGKKIEHNMHIHVGNVTVEIKKVAEIPRTRSGKFRAVLCNLPEETKASLRINSQQEQP